MYTKISFNKANKVTHAEEPDPPGLVVYEVPASELSQSAATPGPSSGTEAPLTTGVFSTRFNVRKSLA
mgnify:CR=1 FL=1